jgi:hypothetical protein
MADIVVGITLHLFQAHGKIECCVVMRLDWGLLVDAQHQRLLGRVLIEPDDVRAP